MQELVFVWEEVRDAGVFLDSGAPFWVLMCNFSLCVSTGGNKEVYLLRKLSVLLLFRRGSLFDLCLEAGRCSL